MKLVNDKQCSLVVLTIHDSILTQLAEIGKCADTLCLGKLLADSDTCEQLSLKEKATLLQFTGGAPKWNFFWRSRKNAFRDYNNNLHRNYWDILHVKAKMSVRIWGFGMC